MILVVSKIPGQYKVVLSRKGKKYVVAYGNDATEFKSMPKALERFEDCVRHALECNGEHSEPFW